MNGSRVMAAISSGLISLSGLSNLSIKDSYGPQKIHIRSYKKGGKPFTNGRRQKSLKSRSNRLKAKSKK